MFENSKPFFLQRKLQQMLPRRQGSQQRQRHLVRFRSHFSCRGFSIFNPFSICSPFFPFVHAFFICLRFFSPLFLSTLSPFPNLSHLQARSSSAGANTDNQSSVRETTLSEIDEGLRNWKYNSNFFHKITFHFFTSRSFAE